MLLSLFPFPGLLTAQTVTCARGDVADVTMAAPHADGNIKKKDAQMLVLGRKQSGEAAGSSVAGLGWVAGGTFHR